MPTLSHAKFSGLIAPQRLILKDAFSAQFSGAGPTTHEATVAQRLARTHVEP